MWTLGQERRPFADQRFPILAASPPLPNSMFQSSSVFPSLAGVQSAALHGLISGIICRLTFSGSQRESRLLFGCDPHDSDAVASRQLQRDAPKCCLLRVGGESRVRVPAGSPPL